MKESEIEKILVSEVKASGGRAYKWVSPGNDGVPDRIVILPHERPIFVELKSDTGKPTKLQELQMGRLKNLGQPVELVKGLKGLVLFFEEYGYLDIARKLRDRYDLW